MAMAMAESEGRTNESVQDDEKGRSVDAGVSTPTSVSMRSKTWGVLQRVFGVVLQEGKRLRSQASKNAQGE